MFSEYRNSTCEQFSPIRNNSERERYSNKGEQYTECSAPKSYRHYVSVT